MAKINSDNCTIRKMYNYISRNITCNDDLFLLAVSCDSNVSDIYINDVILLLMKKKPESSNFKKYIYSNSQPP